MDHERIANTASELSGLLSLESMRELLEAIEAGTDGPAFRHAVRTQLPSEAQPLVTELVEASEKSGPVMAAAIGSAATTRSQIEAEQGRTQIVWTGPPTVPVPSHRPTAAVAHELIASAREHITLATFSAGKVDDLLEALDKRRREGVSIRLLLETPRSDGKGPDCPSVFQRLIPYVQALHWPREARHDHDWTTMHVKLLLRDSDAVLISSANMSRAAMRDNMELGLLIEGGLVPARIRAHFDKLQKDQTIRPLAPS